ncbi:hypothetical protein [Bacillus sp. P14.5]|uniref:hypothetical protein n=1 Tax=Bacillus sp. P14.5 TaxID=1983400 RepID=UPI0013B060E8|nr:hypothetical protein [Bacillus sp. P14.5]
MRHVSSEAGWLHEPVVFAADMYPTKAGGYMSELNLSKICHRPSRKAIRLERKSSIF